MHRIRIQLNATTIVAIAALVFAMAGGALAASSKHRRNSHPVTITSIKQISPKVLKQLMGAPGPAGVEGKSGPAGKDGLNGTPGKDGINGSNGADGKGVSVNDTASSCKAGGITVEVEGSSAKHEVCNGEAGQTGYTDVLPSGKSEYGHWSFSGLAKSGEDHFVAISFPIRLPGNVKPHVIYLGEGEGEAKPSPAITGGMCKGTYASPGAVSGNFCLFEAYSENVTKSYVVFNAEGKEGADQYGAAVGSIFSSIAEGHIEVEGTWAVTAE